MPPERTVRSLFAGLLLAVAAQPAHARQGSTGDSVFVRVQRLASDGKSAAARALVDSVLASERDGSPAYLAALLARASIAESADAARKDYLRIAVDYSASPRAEDALLRLAQMEIARGDGAAAKQYLQRLELEHAFGASRAQGAYWLGRVLLDEAELVPACASFAEAKAHVSPADVELANQVAYYSRPCEALRRAAESARADSIDRATKAAKADSAARADSIAKRKVAAKKQQAAGKAPSRAAAKNEPPKPAPKEAPTKTEAPERKSGRWSAQVAAYASREEAERLAKKLGNRGFETRVTSEKPFRVRIGRFAKRADAVEAVAKLKAANVTAIVVEAERR